jgi:hypothetical protein
MPTAEIDRFQNRETHRPGGVEDANVFAEPLLAVLHDEDRQEFVGKRFTDHTDVGKVEGNNPRGFGFFRANARKSAAR